MCPAAGVSTEGGCLGMRGLGPQSLCDGADLGIAMVLHCPPVIVTVVVIIITIIRVIAIARLPGLEMVLVIDGNKLVIGVGFSSLILRNGCSLLGTDCH